MPLWLQRGQSRRPTAHLASRRSHLSVRKQDLVSSGHCGRTDRPGLKPAAKALSGQETQARATSSSSPSSLSFILSSSSSPLSLLRAETSGQDTTCNSSCTGRPRGRIRPTGAAHRPLTGRARRVADALSSTAGGGSFFLWFRRRLFRLPELLGALNVLEHVALDRLFELRLLLICVQCVARKAVTI